MAEASYDGVTPTAAAGAGDDGRRPRSRRTSRSAPSGAQALDAYEPLEVIGQGSFGRVLVWKQINYGVMSEKEKQLVVSEVNILRELRHPFIVRYYDRIIDKANQSIYVVMEYCEGRDLGHMIKECREMRTYLEEDFVWHCFTQIVLALKACHRHTQDKARKPILHRDLKPGNIFLDGERNVKIGDFGLAKELSSQSACARTNVGTPFYMSPEMINEQRYNEKSDIWALGCIIYELCALRTPFDATNQLALIEKIQRGRFERIPSRYSDHLHRAIRSMLHMDPASRPSVEDLERILPDRTRLREAQVRIQEHQLNYEYASRFRELRRMEEEVRRERAAVADEKKSLEEREAALTRRERALEERESTLSRYFTGEERDGSVLPTPTSVGGLPTPTIDIPRPPSAPTGLAIGGVGAPAPPPRGALRRASSREAPPRTGLSEADANVRRAPTMLRRTKSLDMRGDPALMGAVPTLGVGARMRRDGRQAAMDDDRGL